MKKRVSEKTTETPPKKVSSGLTGAAGVYAAALEISRRDFIASVTSRSAKGVDIIATGKDVTKVVAIQVKTNRSDDNSWALSASDETYHSVNMFYVFVSLPSVTSEPVFFIYKSTTVAKRVAESHAKWLATPGRNGQKHQDNSMRRFVVKEGEEAKAGEEGEGLGRWQLLDMEARVR